jgi:membrane protein DedA with SNARE-associated domain
MPARGDACRAWRARISMDLLQQLITLFAENGYVAVFIALMICGAGLPLPEDITLVAGGVIAGLGYANVHVMFALTMFGVLLGDAAIFLLGHHYGPRMLKWRLVARVLTPERYARVQEKFDRYGNRVLFFARFLPGMRTTVYITAGTTHRVSFWRFR